jgi:hypothetical protein
MRIRNLLCCLAIVVHGHVSAVESITPVYEMFEKYEVSKDRVVMGTVLERCSAVFGYVSGMLSHTGSSELAIRNALFCDHFQEVALANAKFIEKQLGLKPDSRSHNDRKTTQFKKTITPMVEMYAKEGKRNYARTGLYFEGVIKADIDSCTELLKKSMGK